VFKNRTSGVPVVGGIVDIDIQGPDNGSVIVGEIGATYFIFQTIDSGTYGSHPENGSREFGFERNGNQITFYTRGVSRSGNFLVGWVGAGAQQKGWTALLRGIPVKSTSRIAASLAETVVPMAGCAGRHHGLRSAENGSRRSGPLASDSQRWAGDHLDELGMRRHGRRHVHRATFAGAGHRPAEGDEPRRQLHELCADR
jgi:hypothetical protein